MRVVKFRSVMVASADIRRALRVFDLEHRGKTSDSGTGYVVVWRKKRYPPKKILELASGVPVTRFNGGRETNKVFSGLNFIVEKDDERQRFEEPCPSLTELTASLFRKSWVPLADSREYVTARYPGVYVMAYTSANLSGKRVRVEDIFYVGMCLVETRSRLGQFCDGLHEGGHHSAAERFFLTKDKEYYGTNKRKRFFVAWVDLPCRFRKKERSPDDLRKLGTVAALEFYVLATVKEKTGQEPSLNKK